MKDVVLFFTAIGGVALWSSVMAINHRLGEVERRLRARDRDRC